MPTPTSTQWHVTATFDTEYWSVENGKFVRIPGPILEQSPGGRKYRIAGFDQTWWSSEMGPEVLFRWMHAKRGAVFARLPEPRPIAVTAPPSLLPVGPKDYSAFVVRKTAGPVTVDITFSSQWGTYSGVSGDVTVRWYIQPTYSAMIPVLTYTHNISEHAAFPTIDWTQTTLHGGRASTYKWSTSASTVDGVEALIDTFKKIIAEPLRLREGDMVLAWEYESQESNFPEGMFDEAPAVFFQERYDAARAVEAAWKEYCNAVSKLVGVGFHPVTNCSRVERLRVLVRNSARCCNITMSH
jgi:hypothetical protein